MKILKRVAILLLSISLIWTLLVLFNSYQIFSTINEYAKATSNNSKLDELDASLEKNSSELLRYLSIPPFRQLLGGLGLDLSPIKPEIQFATSNFSQILGYEKPQRYLISFQNSAEARGTGGILGAFAVIEFDRGKLKVNKTGSNAILKSISTLPVELPDEYFKLYGNNPGIWQNANLSPHFPYGARNYLELWRLQFGESLDGVIAVDPTAMSHILKATGPITLDDGQEITAENVVEITLATAYKKYETDNAARKEFLVKIMDATFQKLLNKEFSKQKLPSAIVKGILESRILFYSKNNQVEKASINTRISGVLTKTQNNQYRVVIQNIDASKLDYYLVRDVEIKSLTCDAVRKTQVQVYLKNVVTNAQDLPAYVLTRADKNKPKELITGQHRFKLFIYGPYKTSLIGGSIASTSTIQGKKGEELGRPIFITDIDLAPGASEVVVAQFEGGTGRLTYVDQPLVIPTEITISDSCKS